MLGRVIRYRADYIRLRSDYTYNPPGISEVMPVERSSRLVPRIITQRKFALNGVINKREEPTGDSH